MRASSISAGLALLFTISSIPAAANEILNGSFEQGTYTGGTAGSQQVQPGDSTTISNWTVSGGAVTWYSSGNNLNQIALTPHGGNLGLNLADGTSNTVVVGETINNLLPFVEYQLSFWVGNYSANNSPVSVVAQVRDGTSNTILVGETVTVPRNNTNESSNWQQVILPFIEDGTSNTITFGEVNGPSYIGLDDVSVTAVPIADTGLLFASGLGALGLLRWRRKERADRLLKLL